MPWLLRSLTRTLLYGLVRSLRLRPLTLLVFLVLAFGLLWLSGEARAAHDHPCPSSSVGGYPSVQCVYLHGATDDVLDPLAEKVADALAARCGQGGTCTLQTDAELHADNVTTEVDWTDPNRLWGVGIGLMIMLQAALLVAQFGRR